MSQHGSHPEGIRNRTCKLPTGAAKDRQAISCDVVATLNRDLLDGICHVRHGDVDEPLGHLFGRMGPASRITDVFCEFFESGNHGIAIERQICLWPKNCREVLGQHATQKNISVG